MTLKILRRRQNKRRSVFICLKKNKNKKTTFRTQIIDIDVTLGKNLHDAKYLYTNEQSEMHVAESKKTYITP